MRAFDIELTGAQAVFSFDEIGDDREGTIGLQVLFFVDEALAQ
jgi:hypothetical protein